MSVHIADHRRVHDFSHLAQSRELTNRSLSLFLFGQRNIDSAGGSLSGPINVLCRKRERERSLQYWPHVFLLFEQRDREVKASGQVLPDEQNFALDLFSPNKRIETILWEE
jgi:hypothetical protein